MKTTILKYITVTFAAGAMLLAGCNDLDQEPTNKFTDKAFWTSPERANMVLNMAYNQMFGHDKIWQDEALSDNLYEQRGNPDTRTIRMGQATPNTGLFRSEWKWVFEGVKTCNVFMNFVDEVPGMDPERLAGMKAQIRFIRAFLYFRLANFYGDIPFFLQDISLEESRRVSRTPYPEVMSAPRPRTRRDRRRPAHPRRTESRRQRPHHQSRRHDAQGAYVYVRERAAHRQFGFGQHAQGRRYLRQAHPRAGHLRHLQPADPRVRRRHSGL
ncbi:MAG: RagB/SusD family nutrient uptake outer membrane protein [Alistipes finegoldii]